MIFTSSEDAEDAFYDAFRAGGLEDMMRVWASHDDIVCIHPGGPRLTGLQDIRHSWARIFHGALPRTFNLRGRMVSGEATLRIHLLEENISVAGTSFIAPPVLATNVYRREPDGWRMVLHHASVAPISLTQKESGPARLSQADTRLH